MLYIFLSGITVKVLILFGNNAAFHAQLPGLGAPASPPRALDLTSSICSPLLPTDACFGRYTQGSRRLSGVPSGGVHV